MITLQKARTALEAAEKKAEELKIKISTVIVDEHGTPIAMSRMDDALIVSPDFAQAKAFTAASLRMPTAGLLPYACDNKPYFGLNTLFSGKLTTIAGGIPVRQLEKIIGAVGVGGSADPGQDAQCAQEAVAVLEVL